MDANLRSLGRVECQSSLKLYFQGEENAVNIFIPRSTLPLSHEYYLQCVVRKLRGGPWCFPLWFSTDLVSKDRADL